MAGLPCLVCALLQPGLVYDLDVGLGSQEVVQLPHTPTLYPPGLAYQVSLMHGVGECACGRQGWSVQLFSGWRHIGTSLRERARSLRCRNRASQFSSEL